MPYLVSPTGKITAVDNEKRFEDWLRQPGFRQATEDEVKEHQAEKIEQVLKQQKANHDPALGLYMATVSQGGADGYGVASDLLIKQLRKMGEDVKLYYDHQNIAILFHAPYGILQIEAPYRIIYTMFESDRIPDEWHDYLNAADKILVPSKWCQGVFAEAGFQTEVVPLGYDAATYTYVERQPVRDTRRNFTFLHYNAFNARKGFLEVFKAFTQEFRKDEPVKLVLKTTLNRTPVPIIKSQYPNIDVITGKATKAQMQNILARADCFVFPSRGEGFGVTPLEAMATGLPAIVPNAHGISEYFDKKYMYEVKVSGTCPGLYLRYKGQNVGKMVVCDIDDLRRQMRHVYEHETEARKMGKRAAEYVRQWTAEESAKKLKAVIDDIRRQPLPIKSRPSSNILTLEKIT
ncbi:MAG: glycosyltransferase family 4 protein [Bacteroidales bacterium]|jgi:glycosyltransferase involved in cell wall biosynthesis